MISRVRPGRVVSGPFFFSLLDILKRHFRGHMGATGQEFCERIDGHDGQRNFEFETLIIE